MVHGLSDSHAALLALALALGSGAVFLGHLNDAAFWLFKEHFGLSVGGTLRTWTVSHTLLSLTSLAGVLALYAATSWTRTPTRSPGRGLPDVPAR